MKPRAAGPATGKGQTKAKPAAVPKAAPAPAKAQAGPSAKPKAGPPAKQAARAPTRKKPAGKAPGPDRRLAGIRAAAAELSRALDSILAARAGLEQSFSRAASGSLARAQGALGALRKLAESGPLLDVRRLERELAVLAEDAGGLHRRKGKGRKRDLLAVDRFLGDAAARLELAATSAAGTHLGLLSERLSGLEALRRSHQAAISERFQARLERARKVLSAVPEACARLDGRSLDVVARELQTAIGLCKACPVGKLSGKPADLYGIDGLVKRLDRRMEKIQSILSRRKEPSDG
jgi:hypothetical protein